ncbi:hypothetical protein MPSEU_000767500 [Mayamaea pseudoterrestris]|nr:hypothetical protein MPSEU_000767500 [Mayamaea pseudoterrestris]
MVKPKQGASKQANKQTNEHCHTSRSLATASTIIMSLSRGNNGRAFFSSPFLLLSLLLLIASATPSLSIRCGVPSRKYCHDHVLMQLQHSPYFDNVDESVTIQGSYDASSLARHTLLL